MKPFGDQVLDHSLEWMKRRRFLGKKPDQLSGQDVSCGLAVAAPFTMERAVPRKSRSDGMEFAQMCPRTRMRLPFDPIRLFVPPEFVQDCCEMAPRLNGFRMAVARMMSVPIQDFALDHVCRLKQPFLKQNIPQSDEHVRPQRMGGAQGRAHMIQNLIQKIGRALDIPGHPEGARQPVRGVERLEMGTRQPDRLKSPVRALDRRSCAPIRFRTAIRSISLMAQLAFLYSLSPWAWVIARARLELFPRHQSATPVAAISG